jgi:hypothetical protein
VIATDITPITAIDTASPDNVECKFEDAASTWSFPDNSVDYVHIRYLVGSIADWNALFREAFRVLKPGGYVESLEPSFVFQSDDGSVKEGSALDWWGKVFDKAGQNVGRSFGIINEDLQRKGMVNAGFGEPVVEDFKVPISPWQVDEKWQEVGRNYQATMEQGVDGKYPGPCERDGPLTFLGASGRALKSFIGMGWTNTKFDEYITVLLDEIRDETVHGYFDLRNVYARKPDANEGADVPGGAGRIDATERD